MTRTTRRACAAIAVAAALATTGPLAASAAAATGDDWPAATNGLIAVQDFESYNASLHNPDGTYHGEMPQAGGVSDWSPTGARVLMAAAPDRLFTVRHDGSDPQDLPTAASDTHPYRAQFFDGGRAVVFSSEGTLRTMASDGSSAPVDLLAAGQKPSGACDTHPTAGAGDVLYFQRTTDGCTGTAAAIWRFDAAAGTLTEVLDDATAPELSDDGSRIAYAKVGPDGLTAVFVADADGSDPQQVAHDEYDTSPAAWSPDGTRLVVRGEDRHDGWMPEIWTIELATGRRVAPDGLATGAAWQPKRKDRIARVYGPSAAGTNVAASRFTWNTVGHPAPGLQDADAAVVVSNANPTFASLAPSVAAKKHGPVLTTSPDRLDDATAAELRRILPPGRTVYLVGTTGTISEEVAHRLTVYGYRVVRFADTSRYATSVDIAEALTATPTDVFLATGSDYHSILESEAAAGAAGTASRSVALMTDDSTMTPSVYAYLNTLDPTTTRIIPVGPTAGKALLDAYRAGHMPAWPARIDYYPITGDGNTGTSVALARFWWHTPTGAAFVSDDSWLDGVGGFSAMSTRGPVMWTHSAQLDPVGADYLLDASASLRSATVFGGTSSISAAAVETVGDSAAVTGSWTYEPFYNGDVSTRAFSVGTAYGPATDPAGRHHPVGRATRAAR